MTMPEGRSSHVRLVSIAVVIGVLLWMVFAYFLTPMVIAKAYHTESLTVFNHFIRGRASLPLTYYLAKWRRLANTASFCFVVQVSLAYMRLSSILLFAINFIVLGLILLHELDAVTSLVALLFFAIAPPVVLNTKLVVGENLLLLFFLTSYYCLIRYFETRSKRYLVLLLVTALALPLVKIAGLALSVFLVAILLLRRSFGLAAAVGIASGLGVVIYIAYGHHLGGTLIWRVLLDQSQRFKGFGGFLELLLTHPLVTDTVFTYPPFVLGAFCLFFNAVRSNDPKFGGELSLMLMLYVAVLTFFTPDNHIFPWYQIPLYPVLCVGVSAFLVRAWEDTTGLLASAWAVLSLPYIFENILMDGRAMAILKYFSSSTFTTSRYLYLFSILSVIVAAIYYGASRRRLFHVGLAVLFTAQIATDFRFLLRR